MLNHLHIIWQAQGNNNLQQIQNSFIKHTSKDFKIAGKYNFWQRDSLNIELFTSAAFHQKLNYINNNPVTANLCHFPEGYFFPQHCFTKRYRSFWFYRTLFGIGRVFTRLVGWSKTKPRQLTNGSVGRFLNCGFTNAD